MWFLSETEMKEIEATRLLLKSMEMVEGTKLGWWEVLRANNTKAKLSEDTVLAVWGKDELELAIGIIEGKPVWGGDKYWHSNGDYCCCKEIDRSLSKEYWSRCSWLPPKPKTAMVELLVEDIRDIANWENVLPLGNRIVEACRKALSELK